MPQPLQPATFDIPIAPLNQHTTKTGGPVGRLKKLVNGIVKKLTSNAATASTAASAELRVEKRDGFSQLPSAVRDPATGAVSSKALSGPTLFATYGAQLIAVFLAAPFLLSETAGCWESPTYNAPTQVLRSKPVGGGQGILGPSDEARGTSETLYLWQELIGGGVNIWYKVIDDDGTVIRQPTFMFALGSGTRSKAISSGGTFWIMVNDGSFNGLTVTAIDFNGNVLGSDSSVSIPPTAYWDVAQDSATSNVYVVFGNGLGVTFERYRWNGSSVLVTTTTKNGFLCFTGKLGFLTNDLADGNLYLATIDGAGPFAYYGWKITSPSTDSYNNGHQWTVATAQAAAPFEIAGMVDANSKLTVATSFLDATPTPQLNFTTIRTATFAGVSTLVRTQKSLTLVSRAFRMQIGGDYYAVGYYHSNPAGTTGIAQSTFFLMDLGTAYQVAGRWEAGTAYADWQTTVNTSAWFALATPHLASDGGVHVTLAYRASSTIAVTTTGDTFTPTKTLVDVVGIKDYQFGPDSGQAVEHSGALFLPGPEAVNYTGATFAEDGIGLIPEVTTIGAGGGASLTGTYEYVVVDEWTDNNGQRVRSPSGVPFTRTVAAGSNLLTGLHNHVTRKQNMTHAVYRTVIKGGVQTTEHYKVSGSLQGGSYLGGVVVNDDSANTWTFDDNMIDSVAANNEVLYTDKGYLDRFPAPPFSVGLATFDRVFLAGYDGAIWFSGQKTEGDAFWFHPTFRIPMPTKEEITALKVLDDAIVVMCDGGSMFMIPNGPWPDATGAGAFPSPRVLPFSNGCTGWAETISDGIIYSAQQQGIWLITRDFQNRYIGSPVEDEKAEDETFVGVATDDKQRTVFLTSGGNALVYDQVTGVWGTWSLPGGPVLITTHKGRLAYIPQNGAPYRQVIGQYFDGTNTPIVTQARLRASPGGIRRFKRMWQVQMVGERLGDHDMTVTATIDDIATNAPTAVQTWTPSSTGPYVYELPANAATELAAAIDYVFQDSFPRGASQGFALEALSMFVGLGDRSKDVPATQRIGST